MAVLAGAGRGDRARHQLRGAAIRDRPDTHPKPKAQGGPETDAPPGWQRSVCSRRDRAAQSAHWLGLRRFRYLVGSHQRRNGGPRPRGGSWAGTAPPRRNERFRAWSDRLSQELLDDLQAWNDSWDNNHAPQENEEVTAQALQEQGRDLAVRVQNELGTDGWEVLYQIGGQMFRVHPPGIWPIKTWEQELLGYAPRDPRRAEEEARVRRAIRESQPQAGADGSTSTEP